MSLYCQHQTSPEIREDDTDKAAAGAGKALFEEIVRNNLVFLPNAAHSIDHQHGETYKEEFHGL